MKSKQKFDYIQFIGTQRSGSNLLRLMLNQLPEISAPHPPHILKTFYPFLPYYGDLNVDENFQTLCTDVCDWVNSNPVPWEDFKADPHQIRKLCKTNSLLELFERIYRQKAIHDQSSVWCCKSMESIYYVDVIEQSELQPFYIYIYRDGRDVSLSFKKAIVGPKHTYFLAKKWEEEQRLSVALMDKLDPSRFIKVKYEELIAHPAKVMKSICKKLGIHFSEDVFEFFHSHESIVTASSGKMWKNVARPIMPDNYNKYKLELPVEDTMLFEAIAGQMLNQLGYQTEYWPDKVGEEPVSSQQVQEFSKLDEEMMQAVIQNASQEELSRRLPQAKILERVKLRQEQTV